MYIKRYHTQLTVVKEQSLQPDGGNDLHALATNSSGTARRRSRAANSCGDLSHGLCRNRITSWCFIEAPMPTGPFCQSRCAADSGFGAPSPPTRLHHRIASDNRPLSEVGPRAEGPSPGPARARRAECQFCRMMAGGGDQPTEPLDRGCAPDPFGCEPQRTEQAQTARTCIYGHLEECNAQRLSTSSLRRRLRLTLDDPVRPPHHPTDNPVVSVQRA